MASIWSECSTRVPDPEMAKALKRAPNATGMGRLKRNGRGDADELSLPVFGAISTTQSARASQRPADRLDPVTRA